MFINLKELVHYLRKNGSKDLEVIHIKTGEKYYLTYQFEWGSTRLSYLAFIDKESLQVERLDSDIDNDDFEELLEYWSIREVFKGLGEVGQRIQYAGDTNRFLTRGKWYKISRVIKNVGNEIIDDLGEPVIVDTKSGNWYS